MILEVIMPKQGIYDGEVTLIKWVVADGADVLIGDVLFIMENEKVEIDIEAEDSGILVLAKEAGFAAPVGTVIGYIISTRQEYDDFKNQR